MPVDTAIYNAFLQPPKSALDYENQFLTQQQHRQSLQQNALTLQQAMDVQQQRNNLRSAVQGGSVDLTTPQGQSSAVAQFPDVAPALIKTVQEGITSGAAANKDNAQAGDFKAKSAQTTQETQFAAHTHQLQQLATVNNPQDALTWLTNGLSNGTLTSDQFQQGVTNLQKAASDPTGQAFSQWKQANMLGGMTLQDQMAQTTAKPTEVRLGNVVKTIDMNPHSPTYGKEVVPAQAVGVSPDAQLQASTSRANNAATIAAENSRAANSLEVEKVKADPYGTLGLNTTAPPQAAASAGKTGEDYLATLPPGVASQVRALANGKLQITPQTLRTPQGQALLNMAMQYDPGTDQTTYLQRAQTVKDFAPGGKDGQAITNLNTAIHHAGQLSDAIDNLNNSNVLPGIVNPVANLVGQQVLGQTTQGIYKQKADALASELRKVYAGGGGGSLSELNEWQKSFDPNASQQQQRAYLQSGMELLVGALQAKKDAFERGMGPRAQFGQFITPESNRVLTKLAPAFAQQIGSSTTGAQPAAAGSSVPPDIAAILAKHGAQ